jgi:anti-sigma-K factor RskA
VGDGRNEFEDLERELHESLTARSAPLGFTTRVMARIDARKKSAAARAPLWRWIAAVASLAAICLALIVGSRYERRRQEQIAGEHAREQVILALRITGSTLEEVRLKVQEKRKESQP